MSTPSLRRVEEVFHQAVAVAPAQRPGFVAAACAGDADLCAAVMDLLQHDAGATPHFLESPVAAQASQYRAEAPTLPMSEAPSVPLPRSSPPGYELLEELGRGGMGVVYKARQVRLNRIVALKMLLSATSVNLEPLTRFRTEAEALARLNHPNIVAIYDIDTFDGQPYFTMEFVAGPSLAQALDGRPQHPKTAAHLIEVLARAIHAVHTCGIIHRDLKPANVLLQLQIAEDCRLQIESQSAICNLQSAIPKITDFGLAKDQTTARKLTQSGIAMGTPCYMAPEQARHHAGSVGPAADIYALGSILYEMLTARPPFEAATPAATIELLLHEEPLSPAQLRPRLPNDLVTICLKCLEKSPRRRYATALELADELQRFQLGESIRARPVGRLEKAFLWCQRRPLVAGLIGLCALLAVAGLTTAWLYEMRLREALELKTQQQVQIIVEQRRQIVQLNVNIGVIAVDGDDVPTALLRFTEALRLEYDPGREREHRLRIAAALRQCPDLLELSVAKPAPTSASLWPEQARRVASADGTRTATIEPDGTVQVWQATERLARFTPPDGARARLQFSHDGCRLLSSGPRGARLWDAATGQPLTPLLRPGGPLAAASFQDTSDRFVTVSASGTVAVWRIPARGAGDVAPDERPVEALVARAQLLHGSHIDSNQDVKPLTPAQLAQVWTKLQEAR